MKADSEFILRWAKKINAVKYLGGKCIKCGNKNIFNLEFHHKDGKDKDGGISCLLYGRWSKILLEIRKCSLVCRNCHQEIHSDIDSIRVRLKENLLKIKGVNGCEICGYNGVALDFHHVNGKDFGFAAVIRGNKPTLSLEELILEMGKCKVLCRNCHINEHTDRNKFEKFKKEIEAKVDSHKENKKVDRNAVRKMKSDGMGVCEIARKIGCSKAAISMIINNKC